MTSTLSQLLLVYVLGGLTFIPLVLAAVLIPAWLALPKLENGGDGKEKAVRGEDGGDEKAGEKLQAPQDEQYASDGDEGTASGTFAVLRKYDLPAANTALAARNAGQGPSVASGGSDGTGEGAAGSESVYQSMYRSVFDRSRTPPNTLPNTSDDESTTSSDPKARRRVARPSPANVYYIVLRHGHLMLYDSPSQLEVRHVVSLAHHHVSLSDGEADGASAEETTTDGDLFIKRSAILLSPRAATANGKMQAQALAPRPFYLFTSLSIQKEAFYYALLLASPTPPIPQPLDPHDLIKLQTTLHSTLITPETRALNAIVSRIFLALSGTDQLKDFFRAKIEKKISRVQKPGFINALALQAIELGAAAPVVANLRLKDLNISGDVTVSCDVRYTGGISLTLAAQARLDLGPRFKARTVDLLLSSSLKRLSGHMLIRIKPPPSNRLWFCFDGMPDMEIKIEPVVSSRQITYGFILRQIEERIRAVVAETLVKPNWDDIPFFDTRSQRVRGGIWASEGGDPTDEDQVPTEADALASKGEKTMSMPALPHLENDTEGASSGTETPGEGGESELKRRSVASLPAQTSPYADLATSNADNRIHATPQVARPLRSPSFTSPSASAPSVALDDNAANFDPSYKPPPQKARTWGRRHMAPAPTRKEAVDAMREMRDRTLHMRDADGTDSGGEAVGDRGRASEEDDRLDSGSTTPQRTATGFSTTSGASSASANTVGTAPSVKSEGARQKKAANLLAAASTATTAAKNWSWNAIQNRTGKNAAGRRPNDTPSAPPQQEPMGRGQPLPPPGVPLPGPQREKSLWAGSGFGVPGLTGSVKKKPLIPRRPAANLHEETGEDDGAKRAEGGDEFGEWEENSGNQPAPEMPRHVEHAGDEGDRKRKVPPPLPKRPVGEQAPDAVSKQENAADATTSTQALNAAKPTTGTASQPSHVDHDQRKSSSGGETGEADLRTATADLHSSSSSSSAQHARQHETPDLATATQAGPAALPAKAVDSAAETSTSDPEDLVVVAAPMEDSGRNTPVPSPANASPVEPPAKERQEGEGSEKEPPRYDGEEWGRYDDDENGDKFVRDEDRSAGFGDGRAGRSEDREEWAEEEDEEEEGLPKASFSRSRGDGGELYS